MIKPAVAGNSELQDHIQRTLAQGVHGSPAPSESATYARLYVPTTEFTFAEGLWTPADGSGAGLAFTITGTPRYIKMGKLVWVSAWITYPTTADASSSLISGLPFALENNLSISGGGTIGYHDLLVGAVLRGMINTTTLQIRKVSTDNPFTNVEFSGKTIGFTLMYMTA